MLKKKMLEDKIYGVLIKIVSNPAIPILAKTANLDFVFYDCEHGMISYEHLHDTILSGNAIGIPSIVRVAQLARSDVSRCLDCGASGVMVPMMETKEQAQQLVNWSKYPPLGKRSYSGGANTFYQPSSQHRENMDRLNQEVITIAQIETMEGVVNAEAIVQVEGIDALLIGPADLAISIGVAGDVMSELVQTQIQRVACLCKQYGKGFGMIGKLPLMKLHQENLSILVSGIDVNILRDGFIKTRKELEA